VAHGSVLHPCAPHCQDMCWSEPPERSDNVARACALSRACSSPGALYPTNRAAERKLRFDGDECEKENLIGRVEQVPRDLPEYKDEQHGCCHTTLHHLQGTVRKGSLSPPTVPDATERVNDLSRALSHPDLLRKCGWRHVVRLRSVSATVKAWVESGEDAWKLLAGCLADEAGLYMPLVLPGSASASWRSYFFDHLFPTRHKWDLESERIHDHKIRVAVRFKPGVQRERQLVLPLHQRLKMLKKGEKISAEEASGEKGLSVHEVQAQMANMAGGHLDADVLEMLQDAQNLQHAARRAETEANNQGRKLLDKWDDEVAAGGAAADAPENTAAADAGGSGSAGGGGGGGLSLQDNSEIEEEHSETQRRRNGRSRVLSVEKSRVVTFVPGVGVRPFNFANVFDKDVVQENLYKTFAQNAVLCALNGFNACVLAYGQTGSGKTFSLFGPPGWLRQFQDGGGCSSAPGVAECHGVVVRSVCELLEAAQRMNEAGVAHVSISAQYVQVYREVVTCLGGGDKVTLRAGGSTGSFVAAGAAEVKIETPQQLLDLLERGEEHKRYGATAMNDRSSRAHTVLVLNLTHVRPSRSARPGCVAVAVGDASTAGTRADGGEVVVLKSQLLLADLAGCEHINKSKVTGDAKREAASINMGLLVLKKCIAALNQEKSHVPFLESKLTMLLKGALGGSSRTFALVTGSLDEEHGDETVEAMRFGEQCAGVTNTTRTQALSLPAALAAIDKALATCQHGLDSLSSRGKSDLAAYKALQAKHAALSRKREDLADQMCKQQQQRQLNKAANGHADKDGTAGT